MLHNAQPLYGTGDAQNIPGRPICPVTALAFRFDSAIQHRSKAKTVMSDMSTANI
jgi:hypothetical protein